MSGDAEFFCNLLFCSPYRYIFYYSNLVRGKLLTPGIVGINRTFGFHYVLPLIQLMFGAIIDAYFIPGGLHP